MITKTALSNVDLVRRFVFDNQPVTLEQVAAELRKSMASIRSDADARDKYALPVLRGQGYYRESGGAWEVVVDDMPEYKALEPVFREAHQVLYEREVKSKVAQKLGVKVASVVLDLDKAKGLKKFGSRWGLDQWTLANDQAAEVLQLHAGGMNERDLLKHICDRFKLDPADTILNLSADKRFVLERKNWLLRDLSEKRKEQSAPKETAKSTKRKSLDLSLEGSFLQAQVIRTEPEEGTGENERLLKSRLRKAQIKQAQDILEQREDLQPRPEDFAAKMTQLLSAAGVDEQGVKSFQRIEPASKERGLSPKEREEINQFIGQLMEQATVGAGLSVQAVANAPLSARKLQDVLRLKYLDYTRDRAVIPSEFCRLLIDLLAPVINMSILHPSCYEGLLAVELFNYLFEHLEGGAWALVDGNRKLEIVQPDGARYRVGAEDPAMIEQARDKFIVSQVDLLNYFLNNKYSGIEADSVLAKAARVACRLSGYENAYITANDFLSELPEVFGYPANEDNSIPDRFDLVLGNFTFEQDPNLAANYLDQSLKLLTPGGRVGVFVLSELLVLLRDHGLLGEFLKGMAVTHFLRLPLIEGRHRVVLLVVGSLAGETKPPQIVSAEIEDFKAGANLAHRLREGGDPQGAYILVEPLALGTLIH
jgi:hypothetical protein